MKRKTRSPWRKFISGAMLVLLLVFAATGCSRFDAADVYDPMEEMKGNCLATYDEIIVGFDYVCNHNVINISEVTEIGEDAVILQDGTPNYLVQLGDLDLEGSEAENGIRYEFYYDLTSHTILAYRCAFATEKDTEAWQNKYVPLMNACYRTLENLPLPEGMEIVLHNNRIDKTQEDFDSYEHQLAEGTPDIRVTIGTRNVSCDYVELFCKEETAEILGWSCNYAQK